MKENELLQLLQQQEHVILVEPCFHKAQKSQNHQERFSLPLLKFKTWLRDQQIAATIIHFEDNTKYTRYDNVNVILVTTSFTYYSRSVRDCVAYYRKQYPNATIIAGGIYASLLPEHCKKYCGVDEVITGNVKEIDETKLDYKQVDVPYQILQTTRGCIRNCSFCGTYKIEPHFSYKKSIRREIVKKKLIFYDNNLLANPYIDNILNELIRFKKHHKIQECDAQSGIDARLLTQEIADKLHQAGFKKIRFAWDGGYKEHENIRQQTQLLLNAGYRAKDIQVFILYNYEVTYNESEKKRAYLSKLGVQTAPCRYISLDAISDGYNPYKQSQTREEYYIHPRWTDAEVRAFKRNCRQHNICKRYGWNYWTRPAEKHQIPIKKSMHCNNSQKKKQNKKDYSIPTRSKTYDTHTHTHNNLSHTHTLRGNAPHHLHLP